jgi:hypothetical protein
MLQAIPLTILPLIVYNLVGYLIGGADPWSAELFGITMISTARFVLKIGDVLILFAIAMLYLEVAKAARASQNTIANHILSTIVLVIYVVEFIVASVAATSVFLILTAIALFDVIAGFSITIKTATRDIALGQHVDTV